MEMEPADEIPKCVRFELPEARRQGQISGASPFGLNLQMELRKWSFEEMEHALDICVRMGIGRSREEFHWHHIMPERGVFVWDRIDRPGLLRSGPRLGAALQGPDSCL